MKKQVKLTETELFDVIRESVKSLVMEYGTDPGEKGNENRAKMAKVAARNLRKGDDGAYHNAVNSIAKGGGSKQQLDDFHNKFEKEGLNSQPANNITGESKGSIKITESQLKDIIRESVYRILNEVGETEGGQEKLGRLAARKSVVGDKSFFDVDEYAKEKRKGDFKKQDTYAKAFHKEKDRLKDKTLKESESDYEIDDYDRDASEWLDNRPEDNENDY